MRINSFRVYITKKKNRQNPLKSVKNLNNSYDRIRLKVDEQIDEQRRKFRQIE